MREQRHPLGKGEVVSSILTGSTINQILNPTLAARFITFRYGTIPALVQKQCALFFMGSGRYATINSI
jgi:hypothetical protein